MRLKQFQKARACMHHCVFINCEQRTQRGNVLLNTGSVKGAIALGKKIVKVWMMMMKEGIFTGDPSLALPPSTLPHLPLPYLPLPHLPSARLCPAPLTLAPLTLVN